MVRKDLTGEHFGDWEVLEYLGDKKYLCRCSCGVERAVATYSLTSGKSKNCGNKSKHIVEGQKKFKDLTGKVFGELTAIEYEGNTYWKCKCLHGHETSVSWKHLNSESTCKTCRYDKIRKPKPIKEPKVSIHDTMLGKQVNDLTVIKDLGNDRWLCRCKCGELREIRGHSLRHPCSENAYMCRHKKTVGDLLQRFIIGDNDKGVYVQKYDTNNIEGSQVTGLINTLGIKNNNGNRTFYSKEDILEVIAKYKEVTGKYPYAHDLSDMLDVGITTIHNYMRLYELGSIISVNYQSRAEHDIAEYIKTIVGDVTVHNRCIIPSCELDIYIPSKRLAIEINGNYWHSSKYKNSNYHQNKSLESLSRDIRLIHIFEYEWSNPITRQKILGLLNEAVGAVKIYDDKLISIKEISIKQAIKFEEENHIHGKANADINLGLFSKQTDEILGIMSFAKPAMSSDSKYQYELVRMGYKLGTMVYKGMAKLFRYFLDKYNPNSIIAYCDFAKYTGKMYSELGFKICKDIKLTNPDYVWVLKYGSEIIRVPNLKQILLKFGLGTPDMTEDEIMEALKYNKIYDSGNLRFEYWR